ncbi:MAG: PEP-CTERM sorting domain-containing protein [Phycisphaerales bacterium]|nr:PEP-CTERM sorting domain-containing protein [Phycisphaerales bacterium]
MTPSNNTGLGSSIYDWLFAQSLENQGPVNPPALEKAPIVLNIGAGAQSNNNSFDYTADGQRMIVFNHMEAGDVNNMKDINGNETGISVTRVGEIGPGGGTSDVTAPVSAIFPSSSTQTSLYTFGGLIGKGSVMSFIFSGMDDESTYTIDVLGSVTTPLNISSITQYTIVGATTESEQIEIINNKNGLVTFEDMQSVNGQMTLIVTGLNGSLGYINGLRITDTTQAPEPASILLLSVGGLALLRRRAYV